MSTPLAFELFDDQRIESLLPEPKRADTDTDKRRLLCLACAHPITDPGDRIARDGSHRHRFTNPFGLVYTIGCFNAAPGCAQMGAPSAEWTWFAGFEWRIAICRRCQTHLGWGFSAGDGERFFGLILDRLALSD